MSEMEQRAIKYGQWLKSNMDKKDTPEWAKVAEGYKQARALMQQPQQQPQEPDTSFASALKFGFDQSLENVGDSAEVVGATDVAQSLRDFTDAPKNYKPADFIQSGVGEWYDPRDYNWSEAPRAIAESAASMAASIGGGAALGSVGGPVGGVIGAAAGPVAETFGPVVKERMRRNNASEPTTADYLAGGATALGVGALSAFGARGLPAGRAAQAVAGRRALKTISNAATKTSREGLAEGVQDLGQQVGETVGTETGLQIDKKRAVGAGALGAGTRAAMPDIAINTPIKLVDAVLGPQTKVRDREGATYFANRIERISESEGVPVDSLEKLNYANPSDSKVFKTANKEIRREVVNNYNAIKPLLADLSIEDKSVVEAGIMAGQNLFEGISTKDSMQLIQDKAGHTQEGQNLIRLLRESNEASNFMVEMRKSRKGGITGKVDNFVGRKAKEITTGAAAGALGTAGVLQVAGALPAAMGVAAKALPALGAGATLYAGARALDKVTGRRSKAARYLEDYAGRDVTPIDGEPIAAINQRQLEADKAAQAAQETHKETSTRIFREALNAFQSNDPNFAIPDRSWLVDNSDYLTDAHYNALEKRIRLNEERIAKDEKDYNKQVEDEFRNRILKDLTEASRGGGRIPPEMLEQYKPFLKPAEYDRFVTRQNVEDKRVVAFAYQMANQKAAQAEADAKKKREDAEELKRKNRKDEAEQKLKEAEVAEAKAEQDKADAKAVVDSVLAELARMKLTGTLNYEYINDHVDVLGPKEFAKQLDLLKRQQDAQSKLRKQEATKNSGRRVHRGNRSASAAIPTQTRPAPQPTPAVSAEAIGDPNNPVRSSSPTPSLFATGMNTGQVRVKEAFDNKVDVTEAMQDAILAKAEALKGTDQDDLSFALQTFVELIAGKGEVRNRLGGAKNNPAERFKVFKSAIKSLGDDKEAIREFRRDTEDLMLAFGNPLEGDAMDDYVAWKKDNRDTAP